MAKIVIPIPAQDFDPTETAVPWRWLVGEGHQVVFATPDGRPGKADEIMLSGKGLDVWGLVPGLRNVVLVGRMVRANREARNAYSAMVRDGAFQNPLRWSEVAAAEFDGLVLPGGHRARGMRDYLESSVLQRLVVEFFRADKPVGAICHGALIPARSIDPVTGRSVLFGRRTTALTWTLERTAARLGRIVRFWDPGYYRTYREAPGDPPGHMSVESEIVRSLERPSDFVDVPEDDPDRRRRTSGLVRDSREDRSAAFVVRDRNYVSARWPGDAHGFAAEFCALFEKP